MQSPRFRFQLELLSAVMSVAMAACSSSTNENGGSGGDKGSGGKPGAGGQTATGGVSGTGGGTGSGGATSGSGGQTGAGGKTGNGGAASTGGAEAKGGATGAGGSTGAGGEPSRDGGPGRDGRAAGGSGPGGTGAGGSTGSGAGGSTSGVDGGTGPAQSAGCGKTPSSTLKNSPSDSSFNQNTISVSGASRQFIIRWPDDYKNTTPYRLIIGLHGAGGKGADVAGKTSKVGAYFGLWDLAKGSTIFIAPSAGGSQRFWDATSDTAFIKAILELVEAELCIDTSRIMLEGFSQGAALSWTLACGMEGVFRAAVGHSGGGVANPTKCSPIPYFGSGGKKENVTQTTQTDQFARWNKCTIETFPAAPTGGHACNDYKDCSPGYPVRWCPFDDNHMSDPADAGKTTSWMPSEVWPFISQF